MYILECFEYIYKKKHLPATFKRKQCGCLKIEQTTLGRNHCNIKLVNHNSVGRQTDTQQSSRALLENIEEKSATTSTAAIKDTLINQKQLAKESVRKTRGT